MTLTINRVPFSLKDYICTKFGQNPSKDVDPRVFIRIVTDVRKDGRTVALLYPLATVIHQSIIYHFTCVILKQFILH
jgi:hypothetical protein